MSYFKVSSGIFVGIQFHSIEIECVHARRLPFLQILGCSSAVANDLRERIRASMDSSGFKLPARRFTLRIQPNLPNFPVEGLDLPIAIAILGSVGMISPEKVRDIFIFGSLTLDGGLNEAFVGTIIPQILHKYKSAIIPWGDSHTLTEKNLEFGGGFSDLREVVGFLTGQTGGKKKNDFNEIKNEITFTEEISGQGIAKRALEIAAAGSHHVVFFDREPIAGRLASLLTSYLPKLSSNEIEEISINRKFFGLGRATERPFLHANHGFGGNLFKKRFSLSLAHHGVLFCSEQALEKELDRSIGRVMRENTMEDIIGSFPVKFPSEVIVIGSSSSCACGENGNESKNCRCRRDEIRKFERKSKKLTNLFDLSLFISSDNSESGDSIEVRKERIRKARSRMRLRGYLNGRATEKEIFDFPWENEAKILWKKEAKQRMGTSLARIALSICDLREGASVSKEDLLEANFFRYQPFKG